VSKGAVLLHGNALPYTAAHTAETSGNSKFHVMARPPYSPSLTPSDFHLFGPLKEGLSGPSIHLKPRSQGSTACVTRCSVENVFSESIRKPVQEWTKCDDVNVTFSFVSK
jgi:hypothetical protein